MEQQNIILIVEDDRDLNEQYKMVCHEALRQLQDEEGLTADVAIRQAHTYEEAKQILADPTLAVRFISVDLALRPEEYQLGGTNARPGGIRILQELKTLPAPPLSVVLTGEARMKYVQKFLENEEIFAFFQKDFFDVFEYMGVIKCAISYLHLRHLADSLATSLDELSQSEQVLEKTTRLAEEAGHENWPLLYPITQQISLARQRQSHLRTGAYGAPK
jgi:hypothetical protein